MFHVWCVLEGERQHLLCVVPRLFCNEIDCLLTYDCRTPKTDSLGSSRRYRRWTWGGAWHDLFVVENWSICCVSYGCFAWLEYVRRVSSCMAEMIELEFDSIVPAWWSRRCGWLDLFHHPLLLLMSSLVRHPLTRPFGALFLLFCHVREDICELFECS